MGTVCSIKAGKSEASSDYATDVQLYNAATNLQMGAYAANRDQKTLCVASELACSCPDLAINHLPRLFLSKDAIVALP